MTPKEVAQKLIDLAYELDPSVNTKFTMPSNKVYNLSFKVYKFSPKIQKQIEKYQKQGFDRLKVITNAPADFSLADYENTAWVSNLIKSGRKDDKRPKKYVLLYTSQIPQGTKGKTATELLVMFKKKGWVGLTVPEYLLLQRAEFTEHGDHRFDVYDYDHSSKSQWSWLLGSKVSSVSVALGSWNPGSRRVSVHWRGVSDSGPGLGARPAVVIPL